MKYTLQTSFKAEVSKEDAADKLSAILLAQSTIKGTTVPFCEEKEYCFQVNGLYRVTIKSPNEASAYVAAAEHWKRNDFSKLHNAKRGDFVLMEASKETVERD